jgi:nuclear pore complex protein Nup93
MYFADHVEVTSEGEDTLLNFARVIKQYVAPWFKLEPVSALQYAYLVALGADAPGPEGETQKRLSLELVRDVVLASRSWSKLLGSVRADGTKEVSGAWAWASSRSLRWQRRGRSGEARRGV